MTYRSFYVSKSYFAQDTAEDATDEEKTAADEAALAQAEEKAKEMTEACKGDEAALCPVGAGYRPRDEPGNLRR